MASRSDGAHPHARRGARPAGALCWRDGALYRPAKIRVPSYGAGAAPAHLSRST